MSNGYLYRPTIVALAEPRSSRARGNDSGGALMYRSNVKVKH